MNKICPQCNKEFQKKQTTSRKDWGFVKFCSKNCYTKSMKGRVSPKKGKPSGFTPWNKGKKLGKSPRNTTVEKECLECGKVFTVKNYRKETASFCSMNCANKYKDNGKTDKNRKIRQSKEFKIWRELIYERDNWTCQKCGQRGYDLNPHHIQNFSNNEEIRFNIDNGITLCRNCHYNFHSEYGFKNNTPEQLNEFLAVGVES